MTSEAQLTPMMAQYRRIKSELPPDALLLFRLGDFYEMFFEDAQLGAQLLNVALTKRGIIPMCGIPFHAANAYIGRLLKSGKKVAICDQVEDARPGQLVKREVTRILSPGTHFDERLLAVESNNFLAAVNPGTGGFGLALADVTTGEFMVTELENEAALLAELQRVRPAELIYPAEHGRLSELLASDHATPLLQAPASPSGRQAGVGAPAAPTGRWVLNPYEDWVFAGETAYFTLREHFKVASLDGFGLKDRPAAVGATGALLHYLVQHLRRDASSLAKLAFYKRTDFVGLDYTTLRHLEVLEPLHQDSPAKSSLFGALNRTVTPMGARRLKTWLSQPLASLPLILQRQQSVATLVSDLETLENMRGALAEIRDLERTIGRLGAGSGSARDLVALRMALGQVPRLKEIVRGARQALREENGAGELPALGNGQAAPVEDNLLKELGSQLTELPELVTTLTRAIVDEPPLALKEGGIFKDGFDAGLDELRSAMRGGKDWIAKLQQDEIARTGIQSLKVRFNSVFGYYIEVTRSNLDRVPAHYIRKQTIANGERFITPELKEMEGKILGAEERSVRLEYDLFEKLREQVVGCLPNIQATASACAALDVLGCLAESARLLGYCRPQIGEEGVVSIRDGRHPVLEQNASERFVPNDTRFDATTQIVLITGPNMAGKSTYIRQVALLVLLAHTGSFIPAREARIDLVDRIFTRIGASDDLARGQSTFMVEMCETANILNNASPRSLIVLDEIGRGTSTFDGLSLAWSIVEHIHNQVGAKTLFATHYHELTELAGRLARLRNCNVAVREWHDQIVFLRKIVEGGTDKSYGIQVARLAGVPKPVLERAKEILLNLEESELTPEGNVRQSVRRQRDRQKLKSLAAPPQMDLFAG